MIRYAISLVLLTGAAQAQTWEPPEGCTGFLTVQQKGCMLSNHYVCEGDPEGHQWRVDFVEQGPVFASRTNYETEWVESLGLVTMERRVLGDTPDPASLTELLETGIDTYDFVTVTEDGSETRWIGADQLTGQSITIDGHELLEMTFTTQSDDGEDVTGQEGTNYVSEEFRLFLPGLSMDVLEDGSLGPARDNTPVALIEPGEPGFFTTSPIYDCGVQDIALPLE